MLDLLLAIASSTTIGLVFKLSEGRVTNRFTLLMGNYLVASLIALLMWVRAESPPALSAQTALLGLLAGAAFAGNFFLLMVSIRRRGVALPVILLRLSAVVPITVAIVAFGEQPGALQVMGLVGALAAAGLLSVSLRGGEFARTRNARTLPLVLGSLVTLLCFGLSDLMLKLFDELGHPQEKPLFLLILFGTAFLVFAVALLLGRQVPRPRDLGWGLALGVPNLMSAVFMVSALGKFPAFVVFPVVSAGTVMAIALLGALLFKERIGRLGLVGILLTLLSIAAINWPDGA